MYFINELMKKYGQNKITIIKYVAITKVGYEASSFLRTSFDIKNTIIDVYIIPINK
jgi:hypothetical protein